MFNKKIIIDILVAEKCEEKSELNFAYNTQDSVKQKIFDIAHKIYGAGKINYSEKAEESIQNINQLGLCHLPIIMAKTQFSFTDSPKILGAPKDFDMTVRDVEIRSGAGFLVVLLGDMMLMPALGKSPAALNIKIDENEQISGLF